MKYANDGFFNATEKLNSFISASNNILDLVSQIGTIPEVINHDSTEEKLFAKASDAILSRAFRELGLKSTIISERADSADVIARSIIHGYTLVADAKAFRLSRTAKNQKDFKVSALSGWRKDNDYAVLCSPYFQYPRAQSQIYAQAIDNNVCLLSWEHLIFLLTHEIKENEEVNLSVLWGFGKSLSHKVVVAEKKKCFIKDFDKLLLSVTGCMQAEFDKALSTYIQSITKRGKEEKDYWKSERKEIKAYTREKAISELIKAKKIDEKIRQIDSFIKGISRG
ncbi:MAG: HindIII family type II restriction endonuclease [Defluviitaleaceae bacterium]|nr:HindIII family type II restriction endonuclease [Defluviitaleaceae bacterium]